MVAALIVAVLLLGRYHPRSGSDVLNWKPTRSPEQEVENEIDDLDQMLAAANERRRRRGEAELTEQEIRKQVAEDTRETTRRRDRYLADENLDDQDMLGLLATVNRGRRRRGEPELTEAEYRASIAAEQAPTGDGPSSSD